MKLKQFKAKKIHGYIDMTINFKDDLSILIGGNGSGKTSALKLMQALISPSFEELFLTEFEEITLSYVKDGQISSIQCIKSKDIIELRVTGIDDSLIIENIENSEIEYLSNSKSENLIYEKIQELPLIHRKHPVIEYIIKLPSPIFLGLERKYEKDIFVDDNLFHGKANIHQDNYFKTIRNRRLYDGNLSSGLADAQFLIQESYKRLKRYDEINIIKMREELLLSSFKYREFDVREFSESLKNWKEKKELLKKKDGIIEVLSKIDRKEMVLTKELIRFFERLEILLEDFGEEEQKISVELVVNMAQIDKIFELVDIMEVHKKNTDEMYHKFVKFLGIINNFYIDSEKSIELDAIGRIKVKRPNGRYCPISALSSGEKQLMVIFAHVFFNNHNRKEKVFIIDEPELSLHLRWQQIFVSTIMNNCPNTQFIMATHSPDIVDEYDENIIHNWRK